MRNPSTQASQVLVWHELTMESKAVGHENGESHGASRVFRFVDQTDRSQKAVSKHKTMVRSHVMTEIRRQRRSKFRLEPDAGPYFHDPHEGTDDVPPHRSHYTLPQGPSWQFDQTTEADSGLAEQPWPGRDDSPERWQARVASHSPCDVQHAVDLQAIQPSDSRPSGQTHESLQVHTSNPKPTWAQRSSSAEGFGFNQSSEHGILLQDHGCEESRGPILDPPCSFNISPTILGASRVDPFRALPISADREVNELVDNCESIRSELHSDRLEDLVDKKP